MIKLKSGTTVESIVLNCKSILTTYDNQCRPIAGRYEWLNWFSAPGKKGIQRRANFEKLICTLDNQTDNPEADAACAFIKLYDFCDGDRQTSRLIDLIRQYLFKIACVKLIFPRHPSAHAFAAQIAARDEKLDTIAKYMRTKYVTIEDQNAIPMFVLSKR